MLAWTGGLIRQKHVRRVTFKRAASYPWSFVTSMVMAGSYWGIGLDEQDMARTFPRILECSFWTRDDEIADYSGLDSERIDDFRGIQNLPRATIIVIRDNKASLLVPGSRGRRFTFVDPCNEGDIGNYIWQNGDVLFLVRPKPVGIDNESYVHRFVQVVRSVPGFGRSLLVISAVSLFLELISLLAPLQLQWIIDQALPASDSDLIEIIAIGFIASTVIQTLFMAGRASLANWLNNSIGVHWSSNTFKKLLRLPTQFFKRNSAGVIVNSFISLQAILKSFTTSVVATMFDGVMASVVAVVMLFFSPSLTFLIFGFVSLYAVARYIFVKRLNNVRRQLLDYANEQQAQIIESSKGIQSIKACNLEGRFTRRYSASVLRTGAGNLNLQNTSSSFSQVSFAIFGLQRSLVVLFCAIKVLHGELSIGMLVAFAGYAEMFSSRISGMIDKLSDLAGLKPHLERVSLISRESPDPTYIPSTPNQLVDGDLELINLTYCYPASGKPTINGCTLHIRRGEVLGITGRSGEGKTTLVKVIAGLIAPSSGQVRYGGNTLRQVGATQWRQFIAAVMQDDVVFTGTIAANISGFDEDEDFAQVMWAAKVACLHTEIVALDNGYGENLSASHATLSTGQRQRLFIARALYRRPSVLILDESTANLDYRTERLVLDQIAAIGITLIIVSHREQAFANVGRILRFEGGKLNETESSCAAV